MAAAFSKVPQSATGIGSGLQARGGEVVTVAEDKKSVTLDHDDVIGLMKGMKMGVPRGRCRSLEGIETGDDVARRLQVSNGTHHYETRKAVMRHVNGDFPRPTSAGFVDQSDSEPRETWRVVRIPSLQKPRGLQRARTVVVE